MFFFFKWCCCRCFLSVSGAVCFIYNLRGDLSQITEIPGNEKKEVKGHKKTRLHGKSMNILREVWMSSDSELAHHSTQNLIILNKHHHNHFRTVIHFALFCLCTYFYSGEFEEPTQSTDGGKDMNCVNMWTFAARRRLWSSDSRYFFYSHSC